MSNKIVLLERQGQIGLICLTKPPVNALGVALRTAIYDAFQELRSDHDVKAIVIYGDGRVFSAGADIKDFTRSGEQPTLPDLLKALNDSSKPVITSLHGVAFGGALELALASHLRVGVTGLRIGLPEVKLGLLPGAGGTQRLPRLIGIAEAINVICTGRDVSGAEALELGILSRLEDGTALEVGLRAAHDCLDGTLRSAVTDSLNVADDDDAVTIARKRFSKGLKAPLRAIDAISSAPLPIDQGLKIERSLFMELMQGEERTGLVHAFFAERAVAKIPEQNASAMNIRKVGVVGGGTMGVGIATAFLINGFTVCLVEVAADRIAASKSAVVSNLSGALKRGKLSEEFYAHALNNLVCSTDMEDLSEADLLIEAIFE